jgi:L-histidine N-alpha-methyltransferase
MREKPLMTERTTTRSDVPEVRQAFADDVQYYLSLQPRQLPSRYLYDGLGSSLFEAICWLPWYRVTRAEKSLLAAHGRAIFERRREPWFDGPRAQVPGSRPISKIIELGPGSGEKLATLIASGRSRPALIGIEHQIRNRQSTIGNPLEPLEVHLVDLSPTALASASRLLGTLDQVTVTTHEASYEAGLAEAASDVRGSGRTLALFLGSNVGNFDRPGADAFLCGIRSTLVKQDAFLIGADLVKDEHELISAYDDPLGVTAAFNLNLLVRINEELGGDFALDGFTHRAVWNAEHSRIEMHLVSRRNQVVRIRAAGLEIAFTEGESIWTESSYKYTPAGIIAMLGRAGFHLVEQWVDRQNGFAVTLAEV